MCTGAALFALFSWVKKSSQEKSSSCIKSTRLKFAFNEVVLTTIAWFTNAPCPVQCNKHVQSWLSSRSPKKLCKPMYTYASLARSLSVAELAHARTLPASRIKGCAKPWGHHGLVSRFCRLAKCSTVAATSRASWDAHFTQLLSRSRAALSRTMTALRKLCISWRPHSRLVTFHGKIASN